MPLFLLKLIQLLLLLLFVLPDAIKLLVEGDSAVVIRSIFVCNICISYSTSISSDATADIANKVCHDG